MKKRSADIIGFIIECIYDKPGINLYAGLC